MLGLPFPSKWGAAVAALSVCLATAASARAALPDISQAPAPTSDGGITAMQVGDQVRLQFPSQIDIGTDGGPLTITGSRQDASVNTMDAFEDGVSGVVGALQYNFDPTHQHWHYLALDRYDLRTHDPTLAEVARDQKTGFCLVQSDQINPSNCQQKNPDTLSVSETINPGYSDVYDPSKDGQYIDITGLKGTYEFVQWVNADCRLADTGAAGHSWATVLDIDATTSPPTVTPDGDTPYWTAYYAALPDKCLPPETVRPTVSGVAKTGAVLSSLPGSWLERLSNEFAYQWRRCNTSGWACADIPGATSPNYVPVTADAGHTLRARVTGTFAGSTEQATPQDSSPTAVVPIATTTSVPKVASFTAALKTLRRISVRTLTARGLRVRVHCSRACRVSIDLLGRGGVKLAHRNALLTKAGSRTYTVRLSRKSRRIVRRFHSGNLKLMLHLRSHDGERQTLSRTLRLTR
jgi:Lysyl oxidase